MRRKVPCLLAFVLAARVAGASFDLAQDRQTPAPGDVTNGRGLFQTRCADCHGIDAKGVHGPDLTARSEEQERAGLLCARALQSLPGPDVSRWEAGIDARLQHLSRSTEPSSRSGPPMATIDPPRHGGVYERAKGTGR